MVMSTIAIRKMALKNWGLALQELSAIVPAREKQTIVKTAISKFCSAIQVQYDFHRAIYNLGIVMYGLAEDTSRSGAAVNGNEVSPNELAIQSICNLYCCCSCIETKLLGLY